MFSTTYVQQVFELPCSILVNSVSFVGFSPAGFIPPPQFGVPCFHFVRLCMRVSICDVIFQAVVHVGGFSPDFCLRTKMN